MNTPTTLQEFAGIVIAVVISLLWLAISLIKKDEN
jgi:hypothetical protein